MPENSSDPKEKHNSALTHVETTHGTIILLGTAHISEYSVREVRETIKNIRPDLVCIELDQNRYEALNEENRWKNLNIYQVIRQRKTFLLLSSLVLSSYQKRLGMDIGIRPGDEMRAAVQASAEFNIKTAMIDRDISVTLSRAWRKTRLWGKSKLIALLLSSSFSREKADKETIENLKKHSALDDMMTEMANFLPTVKQVLIDERDEYLAIKTWKHIEDLSRTGSGDGGGSGRTAELQRPPLVLAVVGAGHVPGMRRKFQEFSSGEKSLPSEERERRDDEELRNRLEDISTVPRAGFIGKILPWCLIIAIVTLIVFGFINNGWKGGFDRLLRWVLINGSLSAIGSALALAHPVTIILSFLAAPLTSLNPTIGVGFVTGIIESLLRKPRVQDFENLGDNITTIRGFFHNRITRTLLVFLFSSLGSAIGTFVALPMLFS